jgi:hypothetical protein
MPGWTPAALLFHQGQAEFFALWVLLLRLAAVAEWELNFLDPWDLLGYSRDGELTAGQDSSNCP